MVVWVRSSGYCILFRDPGALENVACRKLLVHSTNKCVVCFSCYRHIVVIVSGFFKNFVYELICFDRNIYRSCSALVKLHVAASGLEPRASLDEYLLLFARH